ncbi:MAG TPA: glycosyltransferase family 4 protein, partial [Puia sp.]|nr:glycosyltransferase family 4 protein [Puia sp.]
RFLADPVIREKTGTRFSALWVGRLLPRKGVEILLNTAKLLRDENFELIMVGDGPLKEKTLAFIRDHQLEDTIKFLGWVDQRNIRQYYRSADIMLFLSYRDSSGTQIMEAFSQGVPVISFDQFGASLMINEEVGVKVPLGEDLDALQERTADSIRALIQHPDRVRTMSANALVFASRFTWENKMAAILKDIKPLLTDIKTLVYENADLRLERV